MEPAMSRGQWNPVRIADRLRETYHSIGDVRLSLQLGHFIWRLPALVDRQTWTGLLDCLLRAPRPAAADLRASVARIDRLSRPWFATLFRARNNCYVRSLMFCRFVDPGSDVLRIHFLVEPRRVAGDRLRGHAWVTAGNQFCETPEPEILTRSKSFYSYPAEGGGLCT